MKDNSSRASLAGCQWTMQSRPQLSAAGRAHAGVHIRRDSLRCFDGSVIAASVCPQLGFRYSPPITCYHRRLGSERISSGLSPFPDVSEGQHKPSDREDYLSPVVFCTFYTEVFIQTSDAKVIQLMSLPFISFSGSTVTECHFAHHTQVLFVPKTEAGCDHTM